MIARESVGLKHSVMQQMYLGAQRHSSSMYMYAGCFIHAFVLLTKAPGAHYTNQALVANIQQTLIKALVALMCAKVLGSATLPKYAG